MDYIDIISSISQHQLLNLSAPQSQISKQYPQIKVRSNKQCIFLACLLDKIQNIQIISNVTLNLVEGIASLDFIPTGLQLLKSKNHQSKINLLKIFLQLTAKHQNLNFKLNIKSGHIALNITTLLTKTTTNIQKIIDHMIETLFDLQLQIITALNKILRLIEQIKDMPSISNNQISEREDILKKFKTYIKSSNQYSWHVLRANTKKNQHNKDDLYQQTKKNFRETKKCFQQFVNLKPLSKVNIVEIKQKIPFFMLTQNQDLQLKNRYLMRGIAISKTSQQIEEISLQNHQLEKLLKYNSSELFLNKGKLKLHIKKKLKEEISEAAYQREIIKLLHTEQYIGIPKYYTIKNHQDQTKNIILTNLVKGKSLIQFIECNQQTMSTNTKNSFLTQSIVTLKYLRDHSIVFNNLSPNNLQIKKGIVKFTNFQNCYHPELFKMKSSFNTHFPYVQIPKHGQSQFYSNEKCDIYSFGVLSHYLFFGKTPINIKSSKILSLSELEMKKYFEQKSILGIQNYKNFGQEYGMLLAMLSLMATHCNKIEQDSNYIDLKQERPYLDWMLIIMRFNEENYNRGI